jgi:hypothetical protein
LCKVDKTCKGHKASLAQAGCSALRRHNVSPRCGLMGPDFPKARQVPFQLSSGWAAFRNSPARKPLVAARSRAPLLPGPRAHARVAIARPPRSCTINGGHVKRTQAKRVAILRAASSPAALHLEPRVDAQACSKSSTDASAVLVSGAASPRQRARSFVARLVHPRRAVSRRRLRCSALTCAWWRRSSGSFGRGAQQGAAAGAKVGAAAGAKRSGQAGLPGARLPRQSSAPSSSVGLAPAARRPRRGAAGMKSSAPSSSVGMAQVPTTGAVRTRIQGKVSVDAELATEQVDMGDVEFVPQKMSSRQNCSWARCLQQAPGQALLGPSRSGGADGTKRQPTRACNKLTKWARGRL